MKSTETNTEQPELGFKYAKVNPLDKLHPGEPFFFVRAQDKLAPHVVLSYLQMSVDEGDMDTLKQLSDLHLEMVAWQKANPDKVKTAD